MGKIVILGLILGMFLEASEFKKLKNGDIYDSKTELRWLSTTGSKRTWQKAKAYCEDYAMRLPNLYELKSLVDYEESPAIRTGLIDIKTDGWYWTATPYGTSSAWVVGFGNGYGNWSNHTYTNYVLCVSGQ